MYSNTAQTLPEISKKTIRSTLVSRNVTVAGHRTSVRLEPDMWNGLTELCRRQRTTLHDICTQVAQAKDTDTSLTAAIRVYIMNYYRLAATEDGHLKAGHGYNAIPRAPMQNSAQSPMQQPARTMPAATAAPTSTTMSTPAVQVAPAQIKPSAPFMIGMGRLNSNGSIR